MCNRKTVSSKNHCYSSSGISIRPSTNVPNPAIWAILARFRSSDSYLTLILMIHDGMEYQVNYWGFDSDPIPIISDYKQRRVLASILFSLYLAAIVNEFPPTLTLACETDSMSEFVLAQKVPSLALENFSMVTFRDIQTCITRPTNNSGCKSMSKRKISSSNRLPGKQQWTSAST